MSEALLQIQKALEDHQATLADEPEVHWEGQAYEPRLGTPWLQVQMLARVRAPAGLSAVTPHLWRGQYQVVVKHPAGDGLRAAYARAGRVAAHWPRGLGLGVPPLEVIVTETGLPPAYTTAGWISQPVIIAWMAQERAG